MFWNLDGVWWKQTKPKYIKEVDLKGATFWHGIISLSDHDAESTGDHHITKQSHMSTPRLKSLVLSEDFHIMSCTNSLPAKWNHVEQEHTRKGMSLNLWCFSMEFKPFLFVAENRELRKARPEVAEVKNTTTPYWLVDFSPTLFLRRWSIWRCFQWKHIAAFPSLFPRKVVWEKKAGS